MADSKSIRWWNFLAGWGPLLAFTPILVFEWIAIWSNRPTRIAIVAIPLLLLLLFIRFRRERAELQARQRWAYGFLFSGLLIGIFSSFFLSIPFYLWGGLLCLTAWLLAGANGSPWPKVAGHVGMLALALPWPFNLLEQIQSICQRGSARMLSAMLDGLGIYHIRQNNAIEMADFQFLVDDRLHGIDGLLPLILLAGAISILRSRSFFHSLCLIVSTFVWLIIGYLTFGLIVSVGFDRYDIHLMQSPSSRYGLGASIFLLQIFFLFLADLVLAKLTEQVPTRSLSSDIAFTPVALNGLLTWPQAEPEWDEEEELVEHAAEETTPEDASDETPANDEEVWAPADWSWKPIFWNAVVAEGILVLFGILFCLVFAFQNVESKQLQLSESIVAKLPGEQSMPRTIGKMKWVGYLDENEKKSDPTPPSSYRRSWKYQGDSDSGTVSLVYPTSESKIWNWDISDLGWTRKKTEHSSDAVTKGPNENNWSWMMQHGEDDDLGNIYAWQSALKEDITPLRHRGSSTLWDIIVNRLNRNVINAIAFPSERVPVIGIEVFLERSEPFTTAERATAQEWFISARGAIRASMEGGSTKPPTSK